MRNIKLKKHCNTFILFFTVCVIVLPSVATIQAQVPDSDQGLRADWMRGSWGALWLPEKNYNTNIEGIRIDDFLTQIKDLSTIDYIQVALTSPNIYSPVHTAPHDIIESLWENDTDSNGKPINLVVPRASVDDPFLSWLKAIKAAGLKTEVYVNSYNLLARFPDNIPDDYPELSERWEAYCDTNATVQSFINNHPYIEEGNPDVRKYMFCYAEFILKEYAIRYGDLIDAWCFDSADNIMEEECGDNPASDDIDDQRVYQAFADAVHAGNPNAAIAFNNSVGEREGNPFSTATFFDDYSFGHPFGGAGNMVVPEVLYTYNFGIIDWMGNNNGYAFRDDTRDWNDNVVGHFFPKQSTTSWNAGAAACLTDNQFVAWTSTGIINGGAITWGTPLVRTNLENAPILTLQPYALTQLTLTDNYLKQFQAPGAPNWARQYTILPPAYKGIPYTHTLTEGIDFWDPEGDTITALLALDNYPSWLTITETTAGVWTLSGVPNEAKDTDYEFKLAISDVSETAVRTVELNVFEDHTPEPITVDVEIKAAASTNYGIDNIATMYSEIQTAPDEKATYKISIDVIPPSNKAIISGISGGTATVYSWGVGDGTNANSDDIFTGSDNEWVETIGDVQILDFNANGGGFSLEDISTSFSTITIANAHSSNDDVSFKKDGVTFTHGKLSDQTQIIDLKTVFNTDTIPYFGVGTGNTEATNKWSIEGISVAVQFSTDTLSVVEVIQEEELALKLFPNPTFDEVSFNIDPKKVNVYDVSGKLLKNDVSGSTTMNVSDLNTGVYIVKFFSKQGTVFLKRLIKRKE
ncbi:T9SS type A sorting domain-containing protein [Wenyingzhuangia sp. 1_MG-2023]|nr:T9SS type A sorting domain-containing protein [Wenyingzhuangia sp. 1_MG-2023]